MRKYIEIPAKICYYNFMDNYFEFKKEFRGIKFCYSRKPVIDEREIHTYHEILFYIGGKATFICDGFTKKLSQGSLIVIPKENYHFFKLEDPESFERLKISFNSLEGFDELLRRELDSVRVIEISGGSHGAIMSSLCEALKKGNDSARDGAALLGSLLLLLSSLATDSDTVEESSRHRLISEVLDYIANNLSRPLDTESIARRIGVSPSTLSHAFKQEMGISLHKYVTQKRIALASRLLENGHSPTKIYERCGFGDYSTFYKAYVKQTGRPPSGRQT